MVSYLQKFGRLCHMSEDPIERTHKEDKNLGRTFSHIRDPTLREEAKKNVVQMKSHGTIANLVQQARTKRKRKFGGAMEKRRKLKVEGKVAVKNESREACRTFSL